MGLSFVKDIRNASSISIRMNNLNIFKTFRKSFRVVQSCNAMSWKNAVDHRRQSITSIWKKTACE